MRIQIYLKGNVLAHGDSGLAQELAGVLEPSIPGVSQMSGGEFVVSVDDKASMITDGVLVILDGVSAHHGRDLGAAAVALEGWMEAREFRGQYGVRIEPMPMDVLEEYGQAV